MSDKIEEIRARHLNGPLSNLPPMGDASREEAVRAGWRTFCAEADADRAILLAEVDRQRAENERLREVLKIVRINGPDSNGLVWWSFSREGGVRVSFVVGHEEKMLSQALLEFEQIRRNALEGKP